ncbi:MAG: hypothetical protein VB092_06020 [Oscillospiraceae bacterium]|nr:hypothetical protein [Oscillospiraceae bacterium]
MNSKKMLWGVVAAVLLIFSACGTAAAPQTPTDSAADAPAGETDAPFSFADVANLKFVYSSGAGGWSTELYIDADGSFTGAYHDTEMGTQSYYLCSFSGQFTAPEKVNDYTYCVRMERLETEKEPGSTEEAADGWTNVYSDPCGLDNAKELLFYLPGAPADALPEDFIMWMNGAVTEAQLPFYGLYNVETGSGFSGSEAA